MVPTPVNSSWLPDFPGFLTLSRYYTPLPKFWAKLARGRVYKFISDIQKWSKHTMTYVRAGTRNIANHKEALSGSINIIPKLSEEVFTPILSLFFSG